VWGVGIAASACLLIVAVGLFIARTPLVLNRVVVPVAKLIHDALSDHILAQKDIDAVPRLLTANAIMFLVLSFLAICYSVIWRYLAPMLPARQPRSATIQPPRVSALEAIGLLLVMLLGLALRLPNMTRGLGYDELYTVTRFVDVDSLWQTMSTYSVFNNHIAYSILAHLSRAAFGRQEWALRLPALLLGLGGVLGLWVITRRLFGSRLGIAAALGLALSPMHVLWSVSARGYTGLALFTLVSTYFYLKLLRNSGDSTRGDVLLYILGSVTAVYFHLYAALVIATQALFVLGLATIQIRWVPLGDILQAASFRRLWLSLCAIAGLALLCYAPVLQRLTYWIIARGRGEFQWLFPLAVVRELSGDVSGSLVALPFLVAVIGLYRLRTAHRRESGYFAALLCVPVLVMWLSRPFDLYPRFFIFFLPYYVLLLALGFARIWDFGISRARVPGYAVSGLVVCLAVYLATIWATNSLRNVPEESFRDAAEAMLLDAKPTTLLCAIGGGAELFQYYSDRVVVVPNSVDEFAALQEENPEIRCAYWDTTWTSAAHAQIKEMLSQTATSQRVGSMVVFYLQR
jgi:4-amino-4-deoxy-L-arabinose transferase-like glycosyltransferase